MTQSLRNRKISNSQFAIVVVTLALLQFAGLRFWNEVNIFSATGFFSLFGTIFFIIYSPAYYWKFRSWKFLRHLLVVGFIFLASWFSIELDFWVKHNPNKYCKHVINAAESYKLNNGIYPPDDFYWLYLNLIKMNYYPIDKGKEFVINHYADWYGDSIGFDYYSKSDTWY